MLCKPRKNVGHSLVQEFYTNARVQPGEITNIPCQTYVRGVILSFSKDTIRRVLKIRSTIENDMTFQRHMTPENQDLDAVIRGLCNPHARWACGAGGVPQHLKRRDLVPLARGWHEFIIHAILPTTNKSEVTLKRAILIHAIMKGQEVRAERLIEEHISEIVTSLHLDKPPLAFPNIIARLCEAAKVPIEPDVNHVTICI
ncbi:hypothetical protein PIB30_103880, partial [Stylosanthes scabra]|nr:hypothetical protein [Stylosanthes scabra]